MNSPALLVGLDIGGSATKAVCCTPDGTVLAEGTWLSVPADGTPPEIACVQQLAALLPHAPVAIGAAICGLISPAGDTLLHAPNAPGLCGRPWREALRDRFNVPVVLLNDAKAFVLAEARRGAGQGRDHLLGITLGTGIGGGLVLGGRLYLGAHGWPGELGHVPLDPAGPLCLCGLHGCLEAYIAEQAFVRSYNDALTDPRQRATSGADLLQRAQAGDLLAITHWEHYGKRLGTMCAGVVTLFDLDTLIVGGGLAAAWDYFHEGLITALTAGVSRPADRAVVVRQAALGRHAGALGAALYAGETSGLEV